MRDSRSAAGRNTATIGLWPRRTSRCTSSSTRSGPSSTGSVITFDPDRLAARLAELEREMSEPGFWNDQERAQRISTEHSRVARRLELYGRLRGEYDAGDAVVTLQSGTGGTDAQDWTEMMLRMYERWAGDRKFEVDLLEASPG